MPHRKMARAARRVQAFWPRAKTLSRPNSLRAAEIQPGPPAGGGPPPPPPYGARPFYAIGFYTKNTPSRAIKMGAISETQKMGI